MLREILKLPAERIASLILPIFVLKVLDIDHFLLFLLVNCLFILQSSSIFPRVCLFELHLVAEVDANDSTLGDLYNFNFWFIEISTSIFCLQGFLFSRQCSYDIIKIAQIDSCLISDSL